MGELIQFPHAKTPNESSGEGENIQVTVEAQRGWRIDVYCQGDIHVFGELPGNCLCGSSYWSEDELPEPPVIGIREAG